MPLVHRLHSSDAAAVAEGELCDLPLLSEVSVSAVLLDRHLEHSGGRRAVYIAPVPEDIEPPVLVREPRDHAGLDRGEVRHDEAVPLGRDKSGADELREDLRGFPVEELERLEVPGRDDLASEVEVGDMVLREVLQLNDPARPAPGAVCSVKLKHPADSVVVAG